MVLKILVNCKIKLNTSQLARWNLLHKFAGIISSTEVGSPKIDIVKSVIGDQGISPSSVLMLEDNPAMVQTLIDNGMHGVWINIPYKTQMQHHDFFTPSL